jgi:hypothetical protein
VVGFVVLRVGGCMLGYCLVGEMNDGGIVMMPSERTGDTAVQ